MSKIFLISAKESQSGLALETPGAGVVPFTRPGLGFISLPSQPPQTPAIDNAAKYCTYNLK